MYQFSPCMLWYLVDEKQHKLTITCDLIFLYLVQEYDLLKRLNFKLHRDEKSFLRAELLDPSPLPPQRPQRIDAAFYYNNKISICYHYFLDSAPHDENCGNCGCRKRGFCRR